MRAGLALVSSSSWSSPYSDIISSASDGPSSWEERAAGWRCSGRRSCSDSWLPNHVSVADRGGYLRISPYLSPPTVTSMRSWPHSKRCVAIAEATAS